MSDPELMAAALRKLDERAAYKFSRFFPDCKPGCQRASLRVTDHVEPKTDGKIKYYCRALYGTHLRVMRLGKDYRERLILAANQVGKTTGSAYEVTCHLTGDYPDWWEGRRYDRPVFCWCAGDTMLTTRDILQVAMMGELEALDTEKFDGMIPRHRIAGFTRKSGGVARCVDQVTVKHRAGGNSVLEFRSYDQGRRSFQGTTIDIIWLDEEPPEDVYEECLTRTINTGGMIIATFTPLQGMTPFIQQYLKTAEMVGDDCLPLIDVQGHKVTAYDRFFPEQG